MKILPTISLIVLVGLICLTRPILSDNCLEYVNILSGYETRAISCPKVSSIIDKRQTPTDNMFVVNFQCSVSDSALCDKVKNVFVTAGQFITASLNLKAVINVNAQFVDFCATQGLCSSQETILGAGKPSRLIPFQDPTDGKQRFYPQALFKQLNLPDHPEYGPDDITAIFNSNVKYWFEGDKELVVNQVDMLYVVLHELVHGLGFTPAWGDQLGIEALTPGLGISNGNGRFLELVFDKYLVLFPSGKTLTSIADEINQFQFNPDTPDDQVAQSFKASPQYQVAHDLYQTAMKPGTIGFLTTTSNTQLTMDDVALLETSLAPFQQGSSLGHVDLKTYLSTGDFLMMYTYPHATLGQMLTKAGTTNTTGPIGPKLRTVLGILGYEVKQDYVPPVQLTNMGDPSDIPNFPTLPDIPNPSDADFPKIPGFDNDSSFIRFNLVLSLVCILLTFIYNTYFEY